MNSFLKNADIRILGSIPYDEAMHLQDEEYQHVQSGISNGAVFLLEHDPPVITLGKRAKAQSLLIREEEVVRHGYQIRAASRGGLATVHEPGQAIAYFVVPVAAKSGGSFVSQILQLVADFLIKEYGITVQNDNERPGLWWSGKKICFCGFDLSGGVSRHGIAINVANSMKGFSMIVPCGMPDVKTTSLSQILTQHIYCDTFLKNFASFLRAR